MAIDWQTDYHHSHRYFVEVRRFYRQKKVRVYTEIVFSILTISFFLAFAIKPTIYTIAGLIKEIKDKKIVVEKLNEKINALSLAQQEYQSLSGDLYLIDQALPKEAEISALIKQLEVLGIKTGVIIESVQFGNINLKKPTVEAEAQTIAFNMAVTGNYQNLKDFLKSLIILRRVVFVDSFIFKSSSKEAGSLNLNLTAKAFFLKGD
jgi:Tfp pilus assembly protein PilO